ncbi:DUF3732 domain-containing protein [Thaumasiovibrio subtropicus]|uniref:DUF3732 domain-containing protein n=2 Tax=Thaumasiovibrio subtropicus TaxID=1891207 RepID=UPI001C840B37|nr:DUF3732 domain-containing protein [Thaumasiovibrio subtropicus]
MRSHDSDLIKTSIFENITSHLSDQIKNIKLERVKRTPLSLQVNDEIKTSKIKLKDIEERLKSQPSEVYSFSSLKEKYFFMGQLLAKANLYNDSTDSYVDLDKTKIENEIESIKVDDTSEKKELTIKAIEEIISEYIEMVGTSLENYQGYQPYFKYKEKALSLRKPKSTFEENVGSSSNQMFLHLFFMLSIHEVIKNNNSSFVAPYLIIDQPSRPYYGDESDDEKKLDSSDEAKIKKAFKLLDDFISRQIDLNSNFQMIVLEHVPKKILSEYKHVNIVEEFRHGNALVREENIIEDIE